MEQIKKQKKEHYWVYNCKCALIGIISKENEKTLSKEEYLRGVSCFVINENDEILIEKRLDKEINQGQLDLCSGNIDGNKFDFQAMISQLERQLGIGIQEKSNLEKLIDEEYRLYFKNEGQIRNFFITFFGIRVNKADINFNKEEIQAIAWLDKEKAFELIKRGETKFPKEYDYEPIFEALTEKFFNKQQERDDERE